MSAHFRQYDTADEAAASAAEFLLNRINEAVKKTENASVVLAGGSAPRHINAALLKLDQEINISAIDWYFGDERAVGPESPDSNFRMQMETLLAPLGVDEEIMKACDSLIEIPTYGFKNSLNVATSCSVIGYKILESFGI